MRMSAVPRWVSATFLAQRLSVAATGCVELIAETYYHSLAALYDSDFQLRGPGVMGALNLVVLGGLLGLAGAWLAVARHLANIEPR